MECKICKNSVRIKYEGVTDINFYQTDKIFNWYECNNCMALFILPDENPDVLKKYYFDYLPHLTALLITDIKELNTLSSHVLSVQNLIKEKTDIKLIDVGCGSGNALYNFNHFFPEFELHGLDYNIDHAKKNLNDITVNLHAGDLNSLDLDMKFDIITSSQLLEHLLNPLDYVNFIKKYSHKNTIILTDIPNIESFSYRIFKKQWVHLDTPRHRVLFTRKALEILFRDYEILDYMELGTCSAYVSSLMNFVGLKIHGTSLFHKIFRYIFRALFAIMCFKRDDKVIFTLKNKLSKV